MRYFTDLEIEVYGEIKGQYLLFCGKKYKISHADANGIHCQEIKSDVK